MKTESFIRILAGTFILLSVGLAHFVDQRWLWFTCFIGLNLIQSSLTGFCPPTFLLGKLGLIRRDGTLGRDRSSPIT
jgi:hypothetical protein